MFSLDVYDICNHKHSNYFTLSNINKTPTHLKASRAKGVRKRWPFTRQKAIFYAAVCGLLRRERPPFAARADFGHETTAHTL